MKIDRVNGIKALYGGLLLGGGGGGSLWDGIEILEKVIDCGGLELHRIDEMENDSVIITASLVGSPSSKDKFVNTYHYKRVYDLFQKNYEKPIQGIITNEIGAQTITNGWMLSALTGIPFIDAPCNGRAHPTGVMGSMGLSSKIDYVSIQTCVGGKGENEIETTVRGTLDKASKTVRNTAMLAGGFVTVLRNPVPACYVKEHAAIGSITFAIEIGGILYRRRGDLKGIVSELKDCVGLEVLCEGMVRDVTLATKDGFDLGTVQIDSNRGRYDVTFWNEYMTIENDGNRLATFPDLIAVFDQKTAMPVTSAEIIQNKKVLLVKIPRKRLILGRGMFEEKLFYEVEAVLQKKLIEYVF